jgi:8-oxo-dGTP diphosphatase/putative hydrolase of the HAD superfamily
MNRFGDAKWIFFDVGYTLLDETPAWEDRFAVMARELSIGGRVVTVPQIWETFENVCTEFEPKQWIALCRRVARDESEYQRMLKLADGWRHELQRPYPGSAEMLQSLATRGYKLGIIANQSAGVAERLRHFGLSEHIACCIGSAEAGVVKPDPRIFEMALRETKCAPREAVMIGDRIDNDVRPAKALGWATIHVRQGESGKQRPRNHAETPDASIATITDVVRMLSM